VAPHVILQRLARFEQTGKEGGRQTRSAAKPQYNVCKRHSTRGRFGPGLRKAIRVKTLLYFSFAADTFGSRKLVNTVQMPRGLQRRQITRGKTTKYTNTSKYEYSYLLRPQVRLFRTRAERRNSCREPVKTGVSRSVRSHPSLTRSTWAAPGDREIHGCRLLSSASRPRVGRAHDGEFRAAARISLYSKHCSETSSVRRGHRRG